MSVYTIYKNVIYSKLFCKIKTKVTSLVTLVISVGFALRGQGFFVAFEQRQNVIVGVM